MGAIYEQFERELAGWQRKDAGRPRRAMVRLLLLGLEREELVSVGYREALIARRLATMPIGPQLRELIQHALIWAWKDEEMHAIYLRGAIVRLGSRSLKARAYVRQLSGAIAGWSSSVQQHVRWREAPVARSLAALWSRSGRSSARSPVMCAGICGMARFGTSACSISTPRERPGCVTTACSSWRPTCQSFPRHW